MTRRRSNAMWGRPLPTLLRSRSNQSINLEGMQRAMAAMVREASRPIPALYAAGPLQAERWRKMFPGTTVVVNAQIGAG